MSPSPSIPLQTGTSPSLSCLLSPIYTHNDAEHSDTSSSRIAPIIEEPAVQSPSTKITLRVGVHRTPAETPEPVASEKTQTDPISSPLSPKKLSLRVSPKTNTNSAEKSEAIHKTPASLPEAREPKIDYKAAQELLASMLCFFLLLTSRALDITAKEFKHKGDNHRKEYEAKPTRDKYVLHVELANFHGLRFFGLISFSCQHRQLFLVNYLKSCIYYMKKSDILDPQRKEYFEEIHTLFPQVTKLADFAARWGMKSSDRSVKTLAFMLYG